MKPEPHRLVTGPELRLPWPDAHGSCGRSGEIVGGDFGNGHANCELLTGDPKGTTSAAHDETANTTSARGQLLEAPIRSREAASVSRRSEAVAGEWEIVSLPGAAHRVVMRPHDPPDHGHPVVSEPELPLPDVPLIAEDLLVQATRLVDAGAPTAVVAEILDQVAVLREGRD